ncbi:sensor histidine kinase [Cellulosilyticum sp. I15G10I2]|uniref:sensor histidine kinase n=1 Tax=Cellulosilyticum sp. I15G10I2 TaxID=1892843 RepID=UPI00085BC633|nr:ATP-binding protein [Cellulosilyticum sp. I15G10I2]
MKNKIAFKLTLYFSAVLLLFSIIIGSVFITLFKRHTMALHKTDLEERAVTMASTLSSFINSPNSGMGMMGGRQGGYGAYLRFLDEIAMTDVWIVDKDLRLITSGQMAGSAYNYADLPLDAEAVVEEVFKDNTTFSEGFSNLLSTPTLTIGTPIYSEGKVVGALLLHSPVKGMQEALLQGIGILTISIASALVLSILLSIALAVSFTRPLKKMKNSAVQLARGDYSAKTGVQKKDEIGELASAIDLLSVQLGIASRETEQLFKLRRDFVANISHELRTPVTVIRGSLEALCDEVVTDPLQVKSYHRQMLNESLFLQRLVNDLLDLSRLQNTDFKIEMQELNLCDVIGDTIRTAQHIAQSKNIQIQQEQDTQICLVLGDYGRLRQMFLIILDNAVKFSSPNGVVRISLKSKTVSICDKGVGIAPKDLPYIFDRFYKVKSSENKNGTGLGLAIAKQIADRHTINVVVRSTPDEGTEFLFQF